MNLSLPVIATALPAAVLFAQATIPSDAPSIESLGQLSATAILAWIVWYQLTHTIPEKDKLYREEMAAHRASAKEQTEEICCEFRESTKEITGSFRAVIDEVRTRHRRFDEEAKP